jgi:hypothetical protein
MLPDDLFDSNKKRQEHRSIIQGQKLDIPGAIDKVIVEVESYKLPEISLPTEED